MTSSFPGLPIGRVTLDERFAIVEVDDTFRALFGSAEELIGRPLDELISDRDRRGAVALASRLNQHRGEIVDLPLVISAGGRDHFVRARLVALDERFVVYIEPGDQDSLTFELALARQRWSSLLQRSEEGIVIVDHEGTIVQHNERFFELLRFRTAHGVSLTEAALQGRKLGPRLPRQFEELATRLAQGDDDFVIRVEIEGRTLEVEGRTLRLPLLGRIETLLLVRDLSEQRQIEERDAIIQADLDRAANFQRALLSRMPSSRGLEVDVAYRPLHRVGGDVYDVTLLDDGTVRLFIADSTGHGVTAALSTMLIKSEYDAVKALGTSPGATLGALNAHITRTYLRLELMFSAVIVDILADNKTIVYACGAHPSPLLCTESRIIALPEGGSFVGVVSNQVYPEWRATVERWQGLTLFTDGVIEASNAAGERFGEPRLRAAITDAAERDRKITANVLSRLDAFLDTQAQTDDITLLTVRPRQSENTA